MRCCFDVVNLVKVVDVVCDVDDVTDVDVDLVKYANVVYVDVNYIVVGVVDVEDGF